MVRAYYTELKKSIHHLDDTARGELLWAMLKNNRPNIEQTGNNGQIANAQMAHLVFADTQPNTEISEAIHEHL